MGDKNVLDSSYNAAWEGLWAYAEMALGIVVACSLSIPKLVRESIVLTSAISNLRLIYNQLSARVFSSAGSGSTIELSTRAPNLSSNNSRKINRRDTTPTESQTELNKSIHVMVDIEQWAAKNHAGATRSIDQVQKPPNWN